MSTLQKLPQCLAQALRLIFQGMPTALVLASAEPSLFEKITIRYFNANFRLYRTSDVVGVELGGALKNIIAMHVV